MRRAVTAALGGRRSNLPEPEAFRGLRTLRPYDREEWVVRLRFKQNGAL